MKSYPYIPNMVQAITVLTVLKMMTRAQTSCGTGSMNGKVMYERLPNIQLQGFDDDIVRDTAPPFMVLEKCQDLCLRDRALNNIVRTCTSFDFQPGSRIANFNGGPEYEESTCYLTREQATPEGIGTLTPVLNSVHFTEVCITSTRPERECPNRRYVFERHPRKKLKLPTADIKEMTASNRSECEDKCLNEFSFVCRSASFDSTMRMCTLSRFTRRTHPELLEDDPNSDYLENTCLNAERRCDGLAVFIKEEGKRLSGPFEVDLFTNITLEDCQGMCVRAEKYFCRSIEYDEMTKQCTISEEDSVSQKGDLVGGTSTTHNFYDFACLDSPRGSEYPDNSVTSHLFTGKKPDTAFQRYRNSRLGGEHHSEISGRSLSECLDECLRQPSFQCRSAVYSERFRTCRLSRYNQKDGMRIIYDADYDYYENLMHNKVGGDGDTGSNGQRPGDGTGGRPGDRYPPFRPGGRYPPAGGDDFGPGYPPGGSHGGYPPGGGHGYPPSGNGYPPSSHGYPPSSHGYPPSSHGYPPSGHGFPPSSHDYPPSGHGYPPSTHGIDRYPGDRLPPSSHGIDRYPPSSHGGGDDGYYYGRPVRPDDRYPLRPDDRYRPHDRYPDVGRPGDRLPPRLPPASDDRYPIGPPLDRFPDDDYPPPRRPPPPTDPYPYYPPADRYPPKYPPGTKYPNVPPPPPPPIAPRPGDKIPPPNDKYLPPGDKTHTGDKYPTIDHHGGRPGNRTPYPDDRYPPSPADRFPPADRYPLTPADRLPPGDRYYPARRPADRYPDRYPYDHRYGDTGRGGDRLIPEYDDRYGGHGHRDGDRFYGGEDRYGGNRYGGHRYGGDRYGGDRYGGDRYGGDRYGGERYGGDRYGGDRYGGDRYGGGKYGGGRYDYKNGHRYGNRYDYYGDDKDGGGRWSLRPDRRPGGRPNDDRPPPPPPPYDGGVGGHRRPLSPGPDGPIYDSYGGVGPGRPYSLRCDEGEDFKQVGIRQRIRKEFVRRFMQTPSLNQCQKECVDSQDFICRSFNYRDGPYGDGDAERENCELSDRDSRDMELTNPEYFENTGNFDFYERSLSRQGVDGDCLDVSQVCNEDGMEFTLRTPEGFYGRIYTYGFYDRCFFRGNGGTVNVLRISGAQGYPECGTQRYGDTMTNIVVVQFSDYVQTGKDKRFNLTCLFRGPGEAVVSSGFIGAGSGSPIPIEYLPAENTLSSKVRLLILYQGRPTTTIAVGDPLTFRLEAQDGYNYLTDIFATNVVARDPYSGRSVQLIDRFGCPVDSYVFPELDKGRNNDALEARFNAFKIPESNFLVFEATVRTCREGCQPAYCPSGSGRSEPSFGRRKRDVNGTLTLDSNSTETDDGNYTTTVTFPDSGTNSLKELGKGVETDTTTASGIDGSKADAEPPEFVREMIEVFESREELQQEARKALPVEETVCLTNGEYKGLISTVLILAAILITVSLLVGFAYKKYWIVMRKNAIADRSSLSPISTSYPTTTGSSSGRVSALTGHISLFGTGMQKPLFGRNRNFPSLVKDDLDLQMSAPGGPFEDPSEPIYTDPSLFERSRSLRSISVSQKRRQHSPPPLQMNI